MLARASLLSAKFTVMSKDIVGRSIYRTGMYEKALSLHLLNTLGFKQGDVFLDVGANIGWYSVILGKKFPQLSIYAFEPDPNNFALLTSNLQRNGLKQATAVAKGASHESSEQKLYQYKDSNLGKHSMISDHHGPHITVSTITLDQFCMQQAIALERVKFIKMDIEGFEMCALKGAVELLAHGPKILMEISPEPMQKTGYSVDDLCDFMASFGYAPRIAHSLTCEPVSMEQVRAMTDPALDVIWEKST